MEASLTTVTAWSYGLAGIAFAAFAVQLAFTLQRGVPNRVLFGAVVLSALWGALGWAFAVTRESGLLTATAVVDVLRIGAWYCFLLLLILRPRSNHSASHERWLVVAASGLVLTGLAAQLIGAAGVGAPQAGRIALLDSLGMAVFALVLAEILLRNFPEDSRWSLKPLCIGLIGAFIFDIYVYADALLFKGVDADAFSVRGFVHALVIPLVAISAARTGNWKSKVTLSRRFVFHSAALAASGIYLLFVAAAGYYVRFFGGEWGRAFQVALIFAALLSLGMLAQSGSMRAKLKVLISKHFFSYRYDYREEWLRFTQTLSACDGQTALGQQIIRGLADMVESPSGALWLRDASGRHYAQSARWNTPACSASEDVQGELIRFLDQSGWVVNLDEYRSVPGRYGDLRLPAWLSEAPDAWLIVPLASSEGLMGFVILDTPRTRVDVNWEVNDLFKTAGRQAASFLGQMEATEALLETRKFDAFNRMSAFVVHDLKNIVAQLSLMLKNAQRHKANPEFQQDMLMTVAHATERMKQLMMQLREGTTPVNAPRAVDLAETIHRILRAKMGQEPVPELEFEESLIARGHADRVERVIGHLVQNAIDATGKNGRVWLRLQRDGDKAIVEVRDTGSGMTSEFVRERLFKPFQTTKQSGMGIGAYESFQYVQELGGTILVESTVNVGTTMRVLLPLYDVANPAADEVPRRAAA
ncbi:MAG: XrtA/PEP-CTERM system histidine kinase PrsK [Burkholderiales bacterium]